MNIQIEPIPFGLDKQATSITLDWGKKGFFSDDLTLIINFFDEDNDFFSVKEVPITTAEYISKGATKEERIDNILNDLGTVKIEEEINDL